MKVVVPTLADLRRWSPEGWALRGLVVVTGAAGLAIAAAGGGLPLVAVVIGALGLVEAAIRPGGAGAGVVIGGAAAAWILRYGTDRAPVAGALLLALALAVHHQVATLAAAAPPAAHVQPEVLVRFARHGGLVLALSAVIGVLTLAVGPPVGSAPLELLGVAAVVVVVVVPVLLSRSAPEGRRSAPERRRSR
jgi:hypothetical protein